MIHDEMERIYSGIPPAEIPWNIESPPNALVQLVEDGRVHPCKTLDMGCGAGNYAIYLAGMGFDVTGVDISPSAVALAQANAKKKGVVCSFMAADVLSDLGELSEVFEFAYDWALLHHIFPDRRSEYIEAVHRLLVPGGRYLSVCFSDTDDAFGGTGKYHTTSLGTTLYLSSEEELRELFEPHFTVKSLKTVEVEGKWKPHRMNLAFMEKK